MPRQAREIPDISNDLAIYIQLNPAYETHPAPWPNDPRAQEDLRRLRENEDGDLLPQNEQARRVEMFRLTIRAKIEQLDGNQLWLSNKAQTNEKLKSSQRTFLKTVQELLTHPTERMIFDRDWLAKDDNFNLALESIVIDPRLINNKLLTNLGLTQFIPEPGTAQEDQLAHKIQAIPAIRDMLKKLEPILRQGEDDDDANYFRLMRIGEGEFRGQLIGTQDINGQKRLFRCRDLQDAYRRLGHIEDGYEGEVAKLTEVMTILKDLRDSLDHWNEIKYTTEVDEIKGRLASLVDSLKFAKDKSKRKLKDRIEHAITLKDRSGPHKDKRFNPSKIQATLVGAMGQGILGQRFRKITGTSEKVAEDKVRVGELIQSQRSPIHHFMVKVEKVHNDLLILNPYQQLAPADLNRIRKNLDKLKFFAGELKYEPHLTFGQKFVEQIDKVLAALESNDRPTAAKEFVKLYLVAKLERAYTQIKQAQRKLSLESDGIDPKILKDDLQCQHEELEKHMVAAGITVNKGNKEDKTYYNAFVAVYYLYNSLKARLKEIEGGNDYSKAEKFAEMKERIKEFDFAEIIKTLDHPELENRFLPAYPKP